MATTRVDLPFGVWTEVTGPRAMVDGQEYAVEVAGSLAEAIDVTGAVSPAAGDRGHPWYPGSRMRAGDYRSFTKKAGDTWWWRAAGTNTWLVISEL